MTVDDLVTMLWRHHDALARGGAGQPAIKPVKQLINRVERFSFGTPIKQAIASVEDVLKFNGAKMVNGVVHLTKD